MKLRSIILTLFAAALCGSLQAQVYKTEPLIDDIKTLRTVVDGDFRKLPVIDLNGNSRVEVSFDYLQDDSDEAVWIGYTIVHCDANWKQDNLSELDYLSGVLPVQMEVPKHSFNTITAQYYHYEVSFPNEEVNLLVSGNYAVLFFPQDDPEEVIAVATFSVSENNTFLNGEVTGNTDIDYLQSHQQLNFSLSWSDHQLPYLQPVEDLKVFVRQNRRNDTRRQILQPLRYSPGKAVYEHNRDLIFEGGNNWRQFENNDERYPGIRVDRLRFTQQEYDVWLMTDKSRAHREFYTEPNVNGRYLIHAVKVDDVDIEAEYSWVHFSLEAASELNRNGIYIMGDFTYGNCSDEYRMEFDPESGLYVKDILLKQGAYNYLYSTPAVEGSHYETPNEYDVYVYYHPFGSRYDRLLGVGIIK